MSWSPRILLTTRVHKSNNCNTSESWISQWTGITSNSWRKSRWQKKKKTIHWSSTYALQIVPPSQISISYWNWEKSTARYPWVHKSRNCKRKGMGKFHFSFPQFSPTIYQIKGVSALTWRSLNKKKKTEVAPFLYKFWATSPTADGRYPATTFWLYNQYHQHWYHHFESWKSLNLHCPQYTEAPL